VIVRAPGAGISKAVGADLVNEGGEHPIRGPQVCDSRRLRGILGPELGVGAQG
jgi:hypothetical protein